MQTNMVRCRLVQSSQRINLREELLQKIFHCIHYIPPKRVTSLRAHRLDIALGQCSSFHRNVARVASRWLLCVRFDRARIWMPDFPQQSRTCYRIGYLAGGRITRMWVGFSTLVGFLIIGFKFWLWRPALTHCHCQLSLQTYLVLLGLVRFRWSVIPSLSSIEKLNLQPHLQFQHSISVKNGIIFYFVYIQLFIYYVLCVLT